MNFHFVDRILELTPGRRAIGLKHVTPSDMYLTPSQSGKPALISCIVGEALGQLCSWNIIKATDCQVRSVGGIVSEVNMLGQAYLGDTILLEIDIDHLDDQAVNWSGKASIRGETILIVQSSVGPCLPMQDFNDPNEVYEHLHIIDRPGEFAELPEAKFFRPELIDYHMQLVNYDNIVHWHSGDEVMAQKNISIIAPYFDDHFPRKPVLPISMLLETKLQLALPFISELVGETQAMLYYPARVYNIKMKDFVLPGDILFTQMKLKEHTDEHIVLSYRSFVNDRRICVAEAEFVTR